MDGHAVSSNELAAVCSLRLSGWRTDCLANFRRNFYTIKNLTRRRPGHFGLPNEICLNLFFHAKKKGKRLVRYEKPPPKKEVTFCRQVPVRAAPVHFGPLLSLRKPSVTAAAGFCPIMLTAWICSIIFATIPRGRPREPFK